MTTTEINEALPFSKDAEKAVLGSILLDPDRLVVIEGMLREEHFFLDAHQKIYHAINSLSSAGEAADILTVADRLRAASTQDTPYLGAGYLVELTESAPVSENIENYAQIVRKNFYLRKIVGSCQEAMAKAKGYAGGVEELIEGIEKSFLEIAGDYDRGGLVRADKVLESTIDEIQRKLESDGTTTGVPTGFKRLDSLTGGFQPSDLIILAARPGMGKTALALNVATHAAMQQKSVVIFTLEMSKEQLMSRVLASVARVDSANLVRGQMNEDEQDQLMEGARRIYECKDFLAIDETPGISLMELRSRCRRFKKEFSLDLVVVDYLQLMSGGGGSQDSREREISRISMGLKELAKELRVPVIALAQLNRGPDARPDKRPKISDLRESGSMEQDADMILFVYRDEYYHPDSESAGVAEVIVGKNRHGGLDTIKLAFQPNFVSFQNLFEGEEDL